MTTLTESYLASTWIFFMQDSLFHYQIVLGKIRFSVKFKPAPLEPSANAYSSARWKYDQSVSSLMILPSSIWILWACAPDIFSSPTCMNTLAFTVLDFGVLLRLNYLPRSFSNERGNERNNRALRLSHLQSSSFKSLLWKDEVAFVLLQVTV